VAVGLIRGPTRRLGYSSEVSGVNRMTLSKILNHRGYSTGPDIVDKLCNYFGCSVSDLLEHVPE
jgi:putative transcriptional regulator